MATKIVEMQDVSTKQNTGSPFALVFELEGVAVAGRRASFDVLKGLLAEQGVKLTQASFSRYCMYPSPAFYIDNVLDALDAKKQSTDKLAQDVINGVAMQLGSRDAAATAGFKELLQAAKERGLKLAAFSGLPEQTAQTLADKLGLTALGVELFTYAKVEKVFPRADTLLKIAKSISVSPRYCIVLASVKSTAKAALAAGMRCIALPDEFTAFQDFGGTEAVLDNLTEINPGEFIDDLCPELELEVAPAPAPVAEPVPEPVEAVADVAAVEPEAVPQTEG